MQIVKPGVELFVPKNPLQHIERCARVCYKSEDRIKEGSAEKFVTDTIKRGHESVLEHYSFAFNLGCGVRNLHELLIDLEERGVYSRYLRFTTYYRTIVSGNVRAWRDFLKACLDVFHKIPIGLKPFLRENPVLFPEYQSDEVYSVRFGSMEFIPIGPEDMDKAERVIHQDITLDITCDRGVSHEIVRHRPSGYAQESTRYCNYSKGKFGSEITVIAPSTIHEGEAGYADWCTACHCSEAAYINMLKAGRTPQEARSVLPNSLKTELVKTSNIKNWIHFLSLRTAPDAHPDMQVVANFIQNLLAEKFPDFFEDIK